MRAPRDGVEVARIPGDEGALDDRHVLLGHRLLGRRSRPFTLQLVGKGRTHASLATKLCSGRNIATLDVLDDLRRLSPRFDISPWCAPAHRPKECPGDRRDPRKAGDGEVLLLCLLLDASVEVVLDSEMN